MDAFEQKTVLTSRNLKYRYFTCRLTANDDSKPALYFIHGFPDSASLWFRVVAELGNVANTIIIPDCLGYGGTDKPVDLESYSYEGQAQDLVDILTHEQVNSSIVIGHDWGSALAQRILLHHREVFVGVVLLNTGYMVPSSDQFDLDTVNRLTEQTLGYPQFSYWDFLVATDAAEIIDHNLEKMWQALHGDVEDWMKEIFCVPGSMRNFILGTKSVPLKEYAVQGFWKDEFMKNFETHGFASALRMYQATVLNIQSRSDSALVDKSLIIDVPVLFIWCTQDAVCVPAMMAKAKALNLLPDLHEVVLDCAHWSPMEKPAEVATHIKDFLDSKFHV